MAALRDLISQTVAPKASQGEMKVTVVGAGQVGMAAAFSLLTQEVCSELALVDIMADKIKGEMMDLQHGQAFVKHCKINASPDYSISANSKIIIITAGARQQDGESRLNLVQRNVSIFKGIVPQMVKYSPDAMLMVVANPVDIMTYVTWKISGLPAHRVFGSGTMLDSSRFRVFIADKLCVNPSNIHGYIIGEHGDSSVAVWSGVNCGGIRLRDIKPALGVEDDEEKWNEVHQNVVNSAYDVIKLKGYTSWAIGLMCSTLCKSILTNQHNCFALSTNIKGFYGIENDCFMSLPCVVGEKGIENIYKMKLDTDEEKKFKSSADTLLKVLSDIEF